MHTGLTRVHPVCIACASLVHLAGTRDNQGPVPGWGGLSLQRSRFAADAGLPGVV